MHAFTRHAIIVLLRNDPSIRQDRVDVAMDILSGRLNLDGTRPREPLDRILTTAETAQILRVSERSVLNYAKAGLLKRFIPMGEQRCIGYLESSIREMIETCSVTGRREAEEDDPFTDEDEEAWRQAIPYADRIPDLCAPK